MEIFTYCYWSSVNFAKGGAFLVGVSWNDVIFQMLNVFFVMHVWNVTQWTVRVLLLSYVALCTGQLITCCLEPLNLGRLQLKCNGTWWRTGGETKRKLANAVGSQYPSHYLGTWCIQHYYRWCAHLGCQQSTELTLPPPGRCKWIRPVSQKDEIWFLRVCHHISTGLYVPQRVSSISGIDHEVEGTPSWLYRALMISNALLSK